MRLKKKHSQRGSALLMVVIVVLILVGISFAYMTISYINARKVTQEADAVQALYLAESSAGTKINEWNTAWKVAAAANTVAVRPSTTNTVLPMNGGAYLIPQGSFVDFKNATPSDDNFVSMQVITWAPMPWDSTNNKWSGAANQAYMTKVAAYYAANPTATQPPPPPSKDVIMRKMDVVLSRAGGGVYWNAVHAGDALKTTYMGASYALGFGGDPVTKVGDKIQGDIYSGGAVTAAAPAVFTDSSGTAGTKNTVTAAGSISNPLNSTNVNNTTEPGLQINRNTSGQTDWEAAIAKLGSGNRDTNTGIAYVDVAGDLKKGTYGKWVDGSSATQITDVNNPSHIFRENPTSTSSTTARTQAYEYTYNGKNDFYLEDPTNSVVTHQSVSGVPVNGDTTASALNIQQNGNNAVYFIDGNLRVSGEPIKSYQLTPGAGVGNLKMTMVVKGNISMTDNVLYPTWQSKNDALAMIAIQDPAFPNTTAADFQRTGGASLPAASGMTIDQFVSTYNAITQKGINNGSKGLDLLPTTAPSTWTVQQQELASQEYNKMFGSGNIYFGDPGSGTVEHFESYLYAENNFYATNLDSTSGSGGTSKVEIFGNMTAGNQVRMVRNVTNTGGSGGNYIPLNVLFDDSVKTGSSTPPGLPSTPSFGSGAWFMLGSRQAP